VHDVPARSDVVPWLHEHLGIDGSRSPIVGGQQAADAAFTAFDVAGYADRRNTVLPIEARGASGLSPYVRHGLLHLDELWAVQGPERDVARFRDELLWQEYARHLYARLGAATGSSLRFQVVERGPGQPWPEGARCLEFIDEELATRGWLTNQTRMWLASQWTVRSGAGWRDGEDMMFRALLDGSRAANRLGWQWTVGALTGKPYGFSRWQVMKRAPQLCSECALQQACPIEDWPDDGPPPARDAVDPRLRRDHDPEATAGPDQADVRGEPGVVWLTAESLGDRDPALAAHPDLPAVFVFDTPLLAKLRLTSARLVFLGECLADLAQRRSVQVAFGDPRQVLDGIPLATTFAPVPGWRSRSTDLTIVARYPWPWLIRPHAGPVSSFSAWRRHARR
jgi:deoxyribodipyrimidine photo-lyase